MVSSIGASAISSIGVGSAAFNAIIPALIAVAIGTTAILSRAYGAKNKEEGQKALMQSYFIAIPIGIILMFLFFFFAKPIIEIVGNAKDLNLEDAIIEAMRNRPYTVLIRIEGREGKLIEELSTLPFEKEILFKSETIFKVEKVGFSPNPEDYMIPIKTIWLKEL